MPVERFGALLDHWSGDVPDVAQQIMIDAYRDGERLRLVTAGMRKLGLPDLVVSQVPPQLSQRMSTLINVAAQTLVERGRLDHAGELPLRPAQLGNGDFRAAMRSQAGGQTTVTQRQTQRQPGDPENRLVEVAFPGPAEALPQRQGAQLTALLGQPSAEPQPSPPK